MGSNTSNAQIELLALANSANKTRYDLQAFFKRVTLPLHTLPSSDGLCVETPYQWQAAQRLLNTFIHELESMQDPLWITSETSRGIETVLNGEYDDYERKCIIWTQQAPTHLETLLSLLKELQTIDGTHIACDPNYIKKVMIPESAAKLSYALYEARAFISTITEKISIISALRKRAKL